MGRWTTLHLFNDKLFYNKIVPELKGEEGDLSNIYLEFLRTWMIGGIDQFSENELQNIIQNTLRKFHVFLKKMDSRFLKHADFDPQAISLSTSSGYADYELCQFFQYYIFYTCADFYPHVPCGKRGISPNMLEDKTVGCEVLEGLAYSDRTFSYDGGIDTWITNDEVALLYYDRNLLVDSDDNFVSLDAFLSLLEVAFNNKLGLIIGGDMGEDMLETLPPFKLSNKKQWEKLPSPRLLFR